MTEQKFKQLQVGDVVEVITIDDAFHLPECSIEHSDAEKITLRNSEGALTTWHTHERLDLREQMFRVLAIGQEHLGCKVVRLDNVAKGSVKGLYPREFLRDEDYLDNAF